MLHVANSVDMLDGPRTADVRLTGGDIAIALTTSPFVDLPSPMMSCFVVLTAPADSGAGVVAVLPSDRRPQPRVVMIATCLQLPHAPGRRIVHLVYAVDQFRRQRSVNDESVTAAVAVGRWLFATGGLTHHSEERSAAGDRWARAVGGPLPELQAPAGDFDSAGSGAAIVSMLSAMDWPSPKQG